jgi:hypothetical protein
MAAALGFSALSTVVFILAPSLGWLCYERARTMLLLAALHRRRRQRTHARDALFLARDQFASLDAAGWQAHAGRQFERLGLSAARAASSPQASTASPPSPPRALPTQQSPPASP